MGPCSATGRMKPKAIPSIESENPKDTCLKSYVAPKYSKHSATMPVKSDPCSETNLSLRRGL